MFDFELPGDFESAALAGETHDEHVDLLSFARRIVLLADLLAAEAAPPAGSSG